MPFYFFLAIVFIALACASLILKATILIWSPETFTSLTALEKIYALIWGGRFDLATSAYLMLPISLGSYILIRFFKRQTLSWAWIIVPVILLAAMQLGDLIYFDNTAHHVSYEIKELLNESSGLFDTAISGYPFIIFILFVFTAIGLLHSRQKLFDLQIPTLLNTELVLIFGLFICIVFIRGSLRDKALSPNHAFYAGSPQMATIALTPAFSIISSLRPQTEALSPIYLASPKPSSEFLKNNLEPILENRQDIYKPPHKKTNVVLFLLESWPAELMHSYNASAPITTPELDKLKSRGFSTDGLMASGTRTVVGVFSSLCSYPSPLDSQVPKTKLQFLEYRCLPELMKDAGWQVSMFQGMHDGLTGQLARKLGVTSTFGKLDMPPPSVEPNGWGYQDPDLYDFVLSKAKNETKPFFYVINNTTTHDTHGKQLPSGEQWVFGNANKDEMQKSVLHYADKALGTFIKKFEAENIGPTIFVFTADHTAGPRSGNFGRYWIPFSMFATDGSIPSFQKPGIGSQIDVAPTIIDSLGGNAPWFAGKSLLPKNSKLEGGYFSSGNIGWVKDDIAIEYHINDPSQIICFEWRKDITYKNQVPCKEDSRKTADFSYAFTWYSQDLLFKGKTKQFGQLH